MKPMIETKNLYSTTTTTNYTMETKCDKCGHTWTYKGQYKYATCPSCLSKVEIKKGVRKFRLTNRANKPM